MFKKIEICNVGRYKKAETKGDNTLFKKNTFIYGKNTFGKSTLTAIFRSLKEANSDYVVGRKTIGTSNQSIKIIPETTTPIGEYRYTTAEGKWSAEFKDIIIFDNHFVRESVYTQNQQIGQDQQKSIESFMLGTKGVEYNIKIDELSKKIGENTKVQTSINLEYSSSKHLLGNLSFSEFLDLVEVYDIDLKIEENQKSLDQTKNSELISSKLTNLRDLLKGYKDFDISKMNEKLSVSPELISKHFEDHLSQKENKLLYSSFLETGTKLRKRDENEHCPFCTQEMTSGSVKQFLETVDLMYNDNYKDLQSSIKASESVFSKSSFSSRVFGIKEDLKQAGYSLEIDFTDIDANLAECEEAISKKKDDLSSEFNTAPFISISEKTNIHIAKIDAELENFKNPFQRKTELDTSYKSLLANKERFGSKKDRCEKYLKAKKDNENLAIEKTKIWDEYMEYASGLSFTMLQDINDVLKAVSCDFTVQSFNFKGNQRQDLLALVMGTNPISNDGKDSEMTIKNCLSDSDKWILALAFFLATVKNDTTIKVIVMDDPVSSFDVDRKKIILDEIQRIVSGTDKQLILLTHEKGFYQLIHAKNNPSPVNALLRISFDKSNGSDFIECDPHEDPEFLSDYNCWISDMKNADSSSDLSDVKNAHGCIRKVIEHVLKVKYPVDLTKEHITLDKMLTRLEESGGPYSSLSKRGDIGKILTNLVHHDHSGPGQYPSAELGINDYKKDIRDTFELIKSL